MEATADPFVHHPELRGEILDPFESFFRSFRMAVLEPMLREQGLPLGWWHSDEEREAMRTETLASRPESNPADGDPRGGDARRGDLWVFAYGSLMWDPAVRFAEVRRARVPGHARRFILKDIYGGRGTHEAPGLMAALDTVHDGEATGETASDCEGLLFRIAEAHIEEETRILWQREKIGPAYTAAFVEAVVEGAALPALTFLADHEAEIIDAELSREAQIRYLATGTGFLGSSLDYLHNIAHKFAALGIHDDEVASLLRDTKAYIAARG